MFHQFAERRFDRLIGLDLGNRQNGKTGEAYRNDAGTHWDHFLPRCLMHPITAQQNDAAVSNNPSLTQRSIDRIVPPLEAKCYRKGDVLVRFVRNIVR